MCNTAYFDALQVGSSWCFCTCASVVVENMMHRQALSLLLVFGHELQREAAAVMLFSRVVAPEMFPAVLGACFADASKLRLQQVVQAAAQAFVFDLMHVQRLGPSVCFDSQGPGGPYVALLDPFSFPNSFSFSFAYV